MASDSQLESTSMFGQDRQQGTSATDVQGLIIKRYPVKSLEVSKATTELLIHVEGRPQTMVRNYVYLSGTYVGSIHLQFYSFDFIDRTDTNRLLSMHLWSKKNFTEKNHLKDLVCKVTKKKPEGPIPSLSPDVREQLLQHKKSSRGFLKRSRQSMLNKTTGPKARSPYILGSKAGEIPTAAKLFAKARVRAKEKSFSDDRSKAVWDKYQSLKVTKQMPTYQEDDVLFLEAAGGWTEKGTVYGLCTAAEYFYKRPTTGTCSIKPSYTPSIVSQLQNELDSTKAELNSMKNELQ
ncbi:LOW QUALITY PROTEIN: hypothetical protein Cgig2_013860 [Carnegiea gigantea]|uniref:Uncharacterized protein n=1 Tax=Carnegiea gigantea TaxID=171969 RepID=A0A9Q1KHQ2_9CARY|nr:LOW QUALITY PROTEIN: hypothetical protein Cgig2_013860 [Carnegiea gigantea]